MPYAKNPIPNSRHKTPYIATLILASFSDPVKNICDSESYIISKTNIDMIIKASNRIHIL